MMKKAKIIPVLKKGDRQDIKNYRPISILSVFSKPLEKLMYNRLLSFLKRHNIISNEQHGFMESKSTETASQSFIQIIQDAMNKHLHVIGIFLDISKAYDVINHNKLLDKLGSYGIRGVVNKWFQSYLVNRTQFVKITHTDRDKHFQHRCQSSSKKTAYGIPQGSILGPLLFLLYINDITENISEAKLILYADDTNVLVIEKNEEALQSKLSSVMKHLEDWFHKNDLIINTAKTAAMSFHICHSERPNKPCTLLQNTEIEYKPEIKFLGMSITENLSWHAHICSLCNSLSKTCYIIKSVKNTQSRQVLWNIYFAYFHSRLRYGIILFFLGGGGGEGRA
jgi:hypothetical protein